MHQIPGVAPVALVDRVGRNTAVSRPRSPRRRKPAAFGAFFLALAVVGPAALLGVGSPAAADIGAPDRASVPAESHVASNVLPGDATDVRIDMTENDGLDLIAAASGGGGERVRARRSSQ